MKQSRILAARMDLVVAVIIAVMLLLGLFLAHGTETPARPLDGGRPSGLGPVPPGERLPPSGGVAAPRHALNVEP